MQSFKPHYDQWVFVSVLTGLSIEAISQQCGLTPAQTKRTVWREFRNLIKDNMDCVPPGLRALGPRPSMEALCGVWREALLDLATTSGNNAPPPVDASRPEPPPAAGRVKVLDVVIDDLLKRDAFGAKKYGGSLMSDNGRDALMDAYQEALDLVMYLRQEIIEREGRASCNP